jgi:hypothetical protein
MSALLICRMIVRTALCATVAIPCLFATPQAHAEEIMVAQTTLVIGTDSSVATITVPSAGSLTVELSNLPWPQSLESLSFMLSSSNQVISAWSTDSTTVESYNVSPGTYFAHLTGTAAGPLDLGLYSLTVGFQAGGVVPLPASGALMLSGLLAAVALGRALRIGRTAPTARSAPAGGGALAHGVS